MDMKERIIAKFGGTSEVADICGVTPGAVSGNRYPPAMQAQIDTELLPDEVI